MVESCVIYEAVGLYATGKTQKEAIENLLKQLNLSQSKNINQTNQ